MQMCFFPSIVGIFSFKFKRIKLLFPFCTLIWRLNNYVSRQAKGIKRGNLSTNLINYDLY